MNIRTFVRSSTVIALIMLVLFIAGVLALRYASEQAHQARLMQLHSLALSRETADNSFGLTANVRSYVASGEKIFKDAYFRILDVRSGGVDRPASAAVAPGRRVPLDTLYDEAGFTDEEKGRLSEANRLSGDLAQLEVQAMEMVEKAPPEERAAASLEASAILHGPDYLKAAQAIQVPVGEFERLLDERLALVNARADRMTSMSQAMLFTLLAAAALIAFLAIFWMRRRVQGTLGHIAGDLLESSRRVSDASDHIKSSAEGLARGTTEQASFLEETSAALTEMASSTRQNAANADKTNGVMAETVGLLEEGNRHMTAMTGAMSEINDSSEQIGRIIKTIEDIAFQTNLLALNAAVEAARAGDAGKGFAVVADEVRNLAQRSAQAARDTTTLIEDTIRNVQNGVDISQQLEKSFTAIRESEDVIAGLVREIASATTDQAHGVEQVNQAIAQVDKTTQNTASTSEEEAGAAAELSGQAHVLLNVVGQLLALVGKTGESERRPAPPMPRRGMRVLGATEVMPVMLDD